MTRVPAPSSVDEAQTIAPFDRERWEWAAPFVITGSVAVVAGGLVAAVTGPTDFGRGSWLAAFLVLVAGVGQIALGAGQAWLAGRHLARRLQRAEIGTWNLGVASTIVGTLTTMPWLTTLGGLFTVVALGFFLRGVRRPRATTSPRWAWIAYTVGVGTLLLSTPIGLVLAWIRAS